MTYIKNRKHAQPRFNPKITAAIAGALLLPAVAHAQQSQLPSVEVTTTQDGGYKAERASSAKYTQPLVDTPHTLQVIKRQLIDQQNATTLTEALRNSPGVSTFYLGENGSTNTGDAIYMRGFDASGAIFVDSVRDLGSVSRDMFNIQQVEVLKGAAGTDNGRGSPTGSINLVTKQPELTNYFNASTTVGTGSQKRATADWNKVIDEASGSAFRLNLITQASGVPGRALVENNRSGIAPSFVWGLNTPTRVYLDFLHVEQHNRPDGGVPTVGLPGYAAGTTTSSLARVSSSNYYGQATDYDNNQTNMFTVRVEHDISPNVKLQNTTRYEKTSQDYLLTSFMAITPSTLALARTGNRKNQTNEILTNQTNLTADLQTGSLKHTLVGGVEFTEEKQHALSFVNPTYAAASLYSPDPFAAGPTADSYTVSGYSDGKTDTLSAYLFDTLKFNEKWSMTGGVRVDNYRTTYSTVTTTAATSYAKSGNLFNWKLAASYKPTEYSSIYALYATSQQPPGGSSFSLNTTVSNQNNINFQPEKTKTTEIGTKWDLLNKRLALTAALYNTQVENDVELQDDGTYALTGKKSVKGIELGLSGNITENWSASVGYTYMKNSIDSGAAATYTSSGLAYTPNQAFTSWTTYKLGSGLTIGGGARFVGGLNRGVDRAASTLNPQYTNSYWVFDSMASYVVSKNLTLQLNVNNIFNKDYVASINKSGYRYTPGAERSASLTANFKF